MNPQEYWGSEKLASKAITEKKTASAPERLDAEIWLGEGQSQSGQFCMPVEVHKK